MADDIFRSEDAQQILHLAIARQAEAGELTRSQLLEIAAELDISAAELQAAEQDWLMQRGRNQERQAFDRQRYHRFRQRLIKFLITNGFLVAIDAALSPGLSWSLYLLLFSGMGLSLNAWQTYHLSAEEYETRFQRWRQRQRLKQSFDGWVNQWLRVF